MIIDIAKIPVEGTDYEGELPPSILELENDKFVRAEKPVYCRFHVQVASHELVVQGTIEVELECECSRCTEFFSTTLRDSSFLRAYEVPEGTETVDLTGDIREDILLTLPSFPLCSAECKGLCPKCGRNLNEGPCSCGGTEDNSGPWRELDDLKLPPE